MENEHRPEPTGENASTAQGTQSEPKIVERLRRKRRDYEKRGPIYRAFWVIAGFTVVLAGLAMTVLPGPAIIVIPVGLAMLSLEFAWAQRLLEKSLEKGAAARQGASSASSTTKALIVAGVLLVLAAVAFLIISFL